MGNEIKRCSGAQTQAFWEGRGKISCFLVPAHPLCSLPIFAILPAMLPGDNADAKFRSFGRSVHHISSHLLRTMLI